MRGAWTLALAACHSAAAAGSEHARTAIVQSAEIVDRVLLTGVVHPTHATDLVVPTTDESQLAIRWLAPNGATVKAGDRVVELDATPFTDRLRDGRTQLTSAEAQFKLANRATAMQLHDKTFAVRQREIDLEKARLQANLPTELVPVRTAQENTGRLAQAEDDLRRARKDLVSTRSQLALEDKLKTIDLDKTRRSLAEAEHALAMLVIRAPRDGIVMLADHPSGGRTYRVGDQAEQGQSVAALPDMAAPMDVRAELIDIDDGRIAVHTTGTCTLDAYPAESQPCTVAEIAPVARNTAGHDSLRRAFDVTLSLAHGDPAHMRPGMSVKVELAHARSRGLAIPRSAVIWRAPAMVMLGSGQVRGIELGICDAQRCIVTSGLAAGDVVLAGGGS